MKRPFVFIFAGAALCLSSARVTAQGNQATPRTADGHPDWRSLERQRSVPVRQDRRSAYGKSQLQGREPGELRARQRFDPQSRSE